MLSFPPILSLITFLASHVMYQNLPRRPNSEIPTTTKQHWGTGNHDDMRRRDAMPPLQAVTVLRRYACKFLLIRDIMKSPHESPQKRMARQINSCFRVVWCCALTWWWQFQVSQQEYLTEVDVDVVIVAHPTSRVFLVRC